MMQEKENHIKCQMIQNAEMHTTNICKCVSVKIINAVPITL